MAKSAKESAEERILNILLKRENDLDRAKEIEEMFTNVPWLRQQILDTLTNEDRQVLNIQAAVLRHDRAPTELQTSFAQSILNAMSDTINWGHVADIIKYVPTHREEAGKFVCKYMKEQKDLSDFYSILQRTMQWCPGSREQIIGMLLDEAYALKDESKRALCATAIMFTNDADICEKIAVFFTNTAVSLLEGGDDEDDDASFLTEWSGLWLRKMKPDSVLMQVLDNFTEYDHDVLDRYLEFTKP